MAAEAAGGGGGGGTKPRAIPVQNLWRFSYAALVRNGCKQQPWALAQDMQSVVCKTCVAGTAEQGLHQHLKNLVHRNFGYGGRVGAACLTLGDEVLS